MANTAGAKGAATGHEVAELKDADRVGVVEVVRALQPHRLGDGRVQRQPRVGHGDGWGSARWGGGGGGPSGQQALWILYLANNRIMLPIKFV